jgi:hypothetical protein
MRALVAFPVLAVVGALSGCNSCKRSTEAPVAVKPDEPIRDAGNDADANADAAETSSPKIVVPEIACTTSPGVGWVLMPSAQFVDSDMSTPRAQAIADSNTLELTVSPGTDLTVSLAVEDEKHHGFAPGLIRRQLEGAPSAAKIDAGNLRWKVSDPPGSTEIFQVATHVKLPEGERCVKAPVVVHVVDDDATRAHQIANKLRMSAFYRALDCLWRHQGADLAAANEEDMADEKKLRDRLTFGAPLVTVLMKDLDGDGLKDAIVTFGQHAPTKKPDPPAHWETGPGVQIHLRKGDDFAFVTEAPGEIVEADDGTTVILDTNREEHSLCPPKPYKSTGFNCDITRVEVRKLVGTRIEWIGAHDGLPSGNTDLGNCPLIGFTIDKDSKGRLTGFSDGKRVIKWNEKTEE